MIESVWGILVKLKLRLFLVIIEMLNWGNCDIMLNYDMYISYVVIYESLVFCKL